MNLEVKRLSKVGCAAYAALNTNPLVRRQMSLSDGSFDEATFREWIEGKWGANDLFVTGCMYRLDKSNEGDRYE